MKILCIDQTGSALDWLLRCQRDGHTIKWYIRNQNGQTAIGDGFQGLEKVDDYRKWLIWADLVFTTDNTFYLDDLDNARARGVPVFSPSKLSAELELDRQFGQKLLAKHGIPTIPSREFTDYDTAIAYVKREMKRLVSKPCGNEENKALSYVSKSPEDMLFMLNRWKRESKIKESFVLQEFRPGIEMAVGGWIGPNGFAPGWCENFEFKKLMVGDCGPNTGEMGTVVRVVRESKLARRVLAPLEADLITMGHRGYIDVNCIIDEDGKAWPLEFTARPGWPLFNIQQSLITGDHALWMKRILDSQRTSPWVTDTVSLGVVMAIPDFPYSKLTKKEVSGIPLYGLKDSTLSNFHPCEMKLGVAPKNVKGKLLDVPMLVTAGDYVCVVTGLGKTVNEAKKQAYSRLGGLTTPLSPLYRTDIGDRLKKQLPKLQKHGYATGLSW